MLDGREAVVEHLVLHMELVVLIGGASGLVTRQLDVAVLACQLHHGVEEDDGRVARHQLEQQAVVFGLRTLTALQMEHAHATAAATRLHQEGKDLGVVGKQCFPLCKALLYLLHRTAFLASCQAGAAHIVQPAGIFIADGNAQAVNAHQLVDRLEGLVHHPLGYLSERVLTAVHPFGGGFLRHVAGRPEHTPVDVEHLLEVPSVYQPTANVEVIVTQAQQEEEKHGQPDAHPAVARRTLQLAAIFFERLVLAQQLVEGRIGFVVVTVGLPLLQGKESHGRLVADVQYHMIVRIEPRAPPLQLRSDALALERHQGRRLPAPSDVVFVQTPKGRVGISQRLAVVAVDIAVIDGVGIVGGPKQKLVRLVHLPGAEGVLPRHGRQRVGSATCPIGHRTVCTRSKAHQAERAQPHQGLAHAHRQAEVETAPLAQAALHAKGADAEQDVGLAILLDDAPAIHQAKTASLALEELFLVGGVAQADGFRVADLRFHEGSGVRGREAATVVLDRHLDVVGSAGSVYLHVSALRGVLAGIVHERVQHEEGQGAVGLHPCVGGHDLERLMAQVEHPPALAQQGEEVAEGKALHMEAQGALLHADPQGKDVVVVVDGSHQFVHILIFSCLDFRLKHIAPLRHLAGLVGQAVDVGLHAVDNGQAGFLLHIAPLAGGDVLLANVAFLLQPAAFVAQGDGSQTVLERPLNVGRQEPAQGLFITLQVQVGEGNLPALHHEVPRAEELLHIVGHGQGNGFGHFLLRLRFGRDGGGNLLADVEHKAQAAEVHQVALLRAAVEEPEEHQHRHNARHHGQRPSVQQVHTPLQGLVAALQLLVLTGVFEDVEVDVAVVVGSLLHAQACIRHTELVADARYPFGGRHQLVRHPTLLHGRSVAMVVHLQEVEAILALVVMPMMGVHGLQRHPKRVERLSIAAVLVQVAADFDVGTHRLIHILILGELLQGLLSQAQGEQRVGRLGQQVEGMPAMFAEVVVIFGRRHQPGQALQAAAFEIGEIFLQGHPPRGEELIEVAQLLPFGSLFLHERSRSADVVGIEPLGSVGHPFVGHLADVFQRLGPLLQIIIVDGRHDVELRTGIAEPLASPPLGKEGIVLGNAAHAPQGAVAIIVEFLVQSRPLVEPHQAYIGHQQLQLVLRQLVDGAVQGFGLLEIHLHEGTEGQVVAGFCLARPIEAHRLEGTAGRHPRRVKVAIAPGIGRPVERVDPLHFALRRPAGTRSQCQPCAQQARPTAVHPSFPIHRFLPVLHENKATNKTVKNRRLPARKNVYYHSDGKAAVFRGEKEGFSSFPSAPSHFYTISLGEISKKCLPLQKFNK